MLAPTVVAAVAVGLGPPSSSNVRFMDAAPEAGLRAVTWAGGTDKDHILESTGSGIAFVDYDRDGRLDVYVVNGWALDEEPSGVRVRGANVLYRNLGDGTFEDVTAAAGVGDAGWGCGVCAADFDEDGWIDLYVTNFGPNALYRSRGDGTFEEVAEAAGVAEPGWGAGAAFFDADGDGDLDLYVANYIDCTVEDVLAARRTTRWLDKADVMSGPFGLRGGRDRFYRNEGDGTFTDATDETGLTDTGERYGLGVVASDLDDDGDVDLYVANDSNPNSLYRNDGDGTFTDIGGWCGAGLSANGASQAGMGVDAADYDGDGRRDLFVTNFAKDHCTIYHNTGDLFFDDVTNRHEITLVTHPALSWGCAFVDVDLDADVDLVVINGPIYPQVDDIPDLGESYKQLPLLFANEGGRFVDCSKQAGPGFQEAIAGRGLAVGDYDGDGDPDLAISVMDGPPVLLRNDTPDAGHWLKLRLLNRHGSPAINARALVTAGGTVQVREVRSGSTYQSQSDLTLYFGLGAADRVDRIEVVWPDGTRTVRNDVAADDVLELRVKDE